MNSVDELIQSLSPELIQHLKRAVELGKFLDGSVVDSKQKELMLEAILRYEAEYLSESERTGYIDSSRKTSGVLGNLIKTRKINYD